MGRRVKITKTETRLAIEEADGIILVAAESLGVSQSTMYNYLKRYNLWDQVRVERSGLVELAKKGLAKHLSEDLPPQWAITFTLTTLDPEFEQTEKVTVDFGDAKEHLARIIARRTERGTSGGVPEQPE